MSKSIPLPRRVPPASPSERAKAYFGEALLGRATGALAAGSLAQWWLVAVSALAASADGRCA